MRYPAILTFALGLSAVILTKFPVITVIILGTVGAIGNVVAYDFFSSKDSSFDLRTAWKKYVTWRKYYIKGFFLTRRLEAKCRDIKPYQDRQLQEILMCNADTEYVRHTQLAEVKTRAEFVKKLPLVKYAQFSDRIDRMVLEGEQKVMTAERPLYYAVTSGTTGRPSRIPVTPTQVKNINDFRAVEIYSNCREVPGVKRLTRSMKLYYNVRHLLDRAKDGTQLGPMTACGTLFSFGDNFTTPPVGFDIPDEASTRYIHLLFGLRYRQLEKIETIFVSLAYFAFLDLEKEWKSLVRDVKMGTLKEGLEIDPSIRKKLEERLTPDPQRASELQKEFEKGFVNIAKRIWPNLRVIESITSGPFVHYATAMRQQYTGDVLLYSWVYGSSEGYIGINLWPTKEPANYLLWPQLTFYEFIPLKDVDQEDPKTLFMDQLEKGKQYEIVLTTCCGLYRYRFGDVIKIVDFYGQAPMIEFLYRSGQLLNIKAEKVSELCLMESLKETLTASNAPIQRIVDYTAFESNYAEMVNLEGGESINHSTPHYVVLLECDMKNEPADSAALEEELTKKLDEALIKNHSDYQWYREKGAIGPLELHLLSAGAFNRLREFMLRSTSAGQLKLPKVLRKPELLNLMWNERLTKAA